MQPYIIVAYSLFLCGSVGLRLRFMFYLHSVRNETTNNPLSTTKENTKIIYLILIFPTMSWLPISWVVNTFKEKHKWKCIIPYSFIYYYISKPKPSHCPNNDDSTEQRIIPLWHHKSSQNAQIAVKIHCICIGCFIKYSLVFLHCNKGCNIHY